jgi:hypothetical protein
MKLAAKEDKLKNLCAARKDKDGNANPTRVSDLSFREAYSMIAQEERDAKKKKCEADNPPNYHNAYVAAEEELIEKLELLNEKAGPDAIKEAADITIRHLKNTVDHLLQEKKVA